MAIGIADREGLAGLSMRRVAEELGITAMSLYGYVPGKAELLDLMVDQAHGQMPAHPVDGGWRAALGALARSYLALCLAHPWLLHVATSRPLLGPHTTAHYDRELAAVDGLGLSDLEMDLVVGLVDDYVRGAARKAVDALGAERATGLTDQAWWAAHGPLLAEVLDPALYPTAVRVGTAAGAEYDAASDPVRSFDFGLERVLDGVAAYIDRDGGILDR